MRLFESVGKKPVLIWEIEVVGSELRTREGGTLAVRSFPSESDAHAAAEALIAARTLAGFVEIHRFRTVVQGEPPVKRTEEVEWREGYLRRYARVHQDDRQVLNETGHVFRGGRVCVDRKERWFMSIREASLHFDQALAEGRCRADAPVPPPVTAAWTTDAALERQCRAAPDDPEPFRVFADHLIELGDPRGEIAGLAVNGDAHQARALLEQTFDDLWRPGVELRVELRHGFPRAVRLLLAGAGDAIAAIERVLRSPLCVFVDSIAIEPSHGASLRMDWEAATRMLVTSGQRLTALEIVDEEVLCEPLSAVYPILDGEFPVLRHLGLRGRAPTADDIGRLATCKLLPRLQSLALSNGYLEPNAITALVRHARAFQHLARIDLSRSEVDGYAKRHTGRLERALPNAVVELFTMTY